MIFDKEEVKTYKNNLFSDYLIFNYIDRIVAEMKLDKVVANFSKILAKKLLKKK